MQGTSRLQTEVRGAVLAMLLVMHASVLAAPAQTAGYGVGPPAEVSLHFHDGHLSVRLHHAPWATVLSELGRHTGIRITVAGTLTGTLTDAFAALPLEQGLRRLFREVNLAMRGAAGSARVTVTHVWLFPQAEPGAGPAEAPGARGQGARRLPDTTSGIAPAAVATVEAHAERVQALLALAQQGNVLALQQALSDPDPFIQTTAFALFAEQDRQGAIAALLDLSASAQAEQRGQALALLHQSGTVDEETVLAALRAALADEDTTVKGYAIQALVVRGGTEAFEALHQALRDPDPGIRRLVLESVIQMDDGLPLVQEALADPEETIRALAHARLGRITDHQ